MRWLALELAPHIPIPETSRSDETLPRLTPHALEIQTNQESSEPC